MWYCRTDAEQLHPLFGSNNLIDGHAVMSLVLFLSGRHEREDCWLHLPTLLLCYSNWWLELWSRDRAFSERQWHQPRPAKQDGWESWRAWLIWGRLKKKKKEERSWAAVVCEDTWLQTWNCLLPCNIAASQWAGNPAKMKSMFVYGTASTDHCPLAVNELTLCFNQTEAIWM